MKPADFISRSPKGPPVCVDCNAPATILNRPMPLCLPCARIVLNPGKNLTVCLACLFAYSADEWDRCPNDDCVTHSMTVYDALAAQGDAPLEEPDFFDELNETEDEWPAD